MALFSMRDSWNVWRRKVNEALGGITEPVKAEDVTYSGTTSGLSATNVQSAIDEVVGDIGGLDGADIAYDGTTSGLSATNVQSAIDEVAGGLDVFKGSYVYKGNVRIDVTLESGTIADGLKALADKCVTVCSSLADNEYIVPYRIIIGGILTGVVKPTAWTNTLSAVNVGINGVECSGTDITIYGGVLNTTLADNILVRTTTNASTTSFSNITATSSANRTFYLNYELYEILPQ